MSELDPRGPAPETRDVHFLWLLFGASAAPLAWLGHTMLSYGVTAYGCYPGDHPAVAIDVKKIGGPLSATVLGFDALAAILAASGFAVAWRCWKRDALGSRNGGRNHFLALWGIFSSLGFAVGILFNILASVLVSPC